MRKTILLPVLMLAACAAEPLEREGTWRATGANEANLRAMVADPADLAGREANPPARGQAAAAALDRLRRGRVPALLQAMPGAPLAQPAQPAPAAGGADGLR